MKIIYLMHSIGGDVENNIKDILRIVKKINLEFSDIVPFVPYLADVLALDDNNEVYRKRGIKNDKEIITRNRNIIDEAWLTGDKISKGMKDEIKLFRQNRIPVINKIGEL
jgi:hypothetical protein